MIRGLLDYVTSPLVFANRSLVARSSIVSLWVAAIVLTMALGYGVWTYNRLVSLNKRADGAWSDIDVQLKRRWDLVPALVETVKGYAHHEKETLERVVNARAQAVQSGPIPERGKYELNLSDAVRGLFAVAEAYPELKANRSFEELQRSLVEIEDNIQYARRYYNAVVRDWNTLVNTIPSTWIAAAADYRERPYFQLDDSERAAPRVTLDTAPGSGAGPEAGPGPDPNRAAPRHPG
jgi:LemA protein